MNKQELIGAVADVTGLSRGDATRAVEGVFDTITGALKRDPAQVQGGQGAEGFGRALNRRGCGWTARASLTKWPLPQAWARSSVVEHTLHTGGVVGSIPTAPTTPFLVIASESK